MRKYSNENDIDLHESGRGRETNFHMNGFAQRLVLTCTEAKTQRWPIQGVTYFVCHTIQGVTVHTSRNHVTILI